MENDKAADLLEEILEQEKAANTSLNDLALTHNNEEALAAEAADASSEKAIHHSQKAA